MHGSVGTNPDDLLSTNSALVTPWVHGLDLCTTLLDGVRLSPTEHRWAAYEAGRRVSTDAISLVSTVRMGFEEPLLLFDLEMTPTSTSTSTLTTQTVNLTVLPHPLIRQYDAFPWVLSYPNVTNEFLFVVDKSKTPGSHPRILTTDSHSAAVSSFELVEIVGGGASASSVTVTAVANVSGRIEIQLTLEPHVVATQVRFALRFGNTTSSTAMTPTEFDKAWALSAAAWEKRWEQAFTPGNPHFSGHLPTLTTTESGLSDIYYMSILTILSLERTNLAVFDRTYLTASGNALRYDCESCLPNVGGILEVGGSAAYVAPCMTTVRQTVRVLTTRLSCVLQK
jgi:hypothetical protein